MLFDKSVICPVVIGRENDLQLLDRLLRQSREGSGQTVRISGDAGIGKSRLIKEVKTHLPESTLILEGNCFQTEAALPYAPLLDLFRNLFATYSNQELGHTLVATAPQLVQLFPELSIHLPDAPSTPSPEPKQEKQRLFQALARTLIELGRQQPLVIVIEDLHWSDSTSLEFLLLFAHRIVNQAILLLVTHRTEETTPELTHFLAELDRERLGTEIVLKPMSPPEADAMLRSIFEQKVPTSKEFLDTIFSLTEGNPFFIEEILKALVSAGDIYYSNGTWDRKALNQLQIPRTIHDAVQRRTGQLDQRTLQALTLASVTGRRFNFQLLQEILEVNETELMAMLKELIAAQLVVEESADRFAFRHALTREAIYTTLLLRERQAYHRRVGEAIERLYATSIRLHLADLSYHYYTGGVWQKAFDCSVKAGEQAQELYSQREAVVYYSRALACAHHLDITVQPELPGARGQAYEILGDFRSALDDFEEALKIAQKQQDGRAEWQSLINLGDLWAGHDYQRTGEFFRQAEELARKLHEPKLLAHSFNHVGSWYFIQGQTRQALEYHRQALEFFERDGDEPGMAETRDQLGMATLHHGDQVGSYEEYRHAIRLLRKLDDKHGLISALIGACHTLYDETDLVPAQSRLENETMAMEALELARQLGWASAEAFAEWGLAMGLAQWGMFEEALAHAQAMLQIAVEIDNPQRLTGAYYALGYIYVLMLQAGPAIHNLEAGLDLAKKYSLSAWLIGNITTELANAYLLNGDTSRSRALLDSGLQDETGIHTRAERRMLSAKGNLLLAENKPAEALHLAEHLLDSKRDPAEAQPIPGLLKLQGEALLALKQFKEAEQALEAAKRGAEQRELLPLLWQIHARLGWLYKEQKDFEQSEREFASARQMIRKLEASIRAEALRAGFTNAALAALPQERTISKRQSEAEKFGGLTPREREVARFLSQGKSNREIAEQLVLSERTVENHVGNILTKLGFDSRAQVAVWAVEKGLGLHEKN